MVNGNDIRNLTYDMNLIGLDINKEQDLQYFIKRLEKDLSIAKFCLNKPIVVNASVSE